MGDGRDVAADLVLLSLAINPSLLPPGAPADVYFANEEGNIGLVLAGVAGPITC